MTLAYIYILNRYLVHTSFVETYTSPKYIEVFIKPQNFISNIYASFIALAIALASAVCALCLLSENVHAGESGDKNDSGYKNLSFRTLTAPVLDSIGRVAGLEQDNQGFMWLGGENGIVRYDAYNFKLFRHDPDDINSLSSNNIFGILTDKRDNLWISTGFGLNRYDLRKERFTRYYHEKNNPESLGSDSIQTQLLDSQGRLWFGTIAGGLNRYHYESNTFEHIDIAKIAGQPENVGLSNIWVIVEDEFHRLWLATDDGVVLYDHKQGVIEHFNRQSKDVKSIKSNRVRALFLDTTGGLWIGTANGLNYYSINDKVLKSYPLDFKSGVDSSDEYVTSVLADNNKRIWVSTHDGGIYIYDSETESFSQHRHRPGDDRSLPGNKIRTMIRDKNGDIWIGFFPYGLAVLDIKASAFFRYKHNMYDASSLSHSSVLSVDEDDIGNLWIGTEYGLNYFDRQAGTFTRYLHDENNPESIAGDPIISLVNTRSGDLWTASWFLGVSRLNKKNGTFKHYRANSSDPTSLLKNSVWKIYEDRQGDIWVGALELSVVRYRPETDDFERYPMDIKSPRGNVTSFYEDRSGNFWLGSDRGLHLLDRKTKLYRHYISDKNDPKSIVNGAVMTIAEVDDGRLVLGMWGGGVSLFDPEKEEFKSYSSKHGLSDDGVTGILTDDQNMLWLATANGLSRFDPRTETFKTYREHDGISGNVYNRSAHKKTSKGELVFGSTEGLTIFNPEDIYTNEIAPPVVVTELRILNKVLEINNRKNTGDIKSPLEQAINYTKELTLSDRDTVFSFHFVALNYNVPENNRYAYRLQGFDQDWNYVGNQRSATYTNIDPGNYVFHVKASNNEDVWNEQGTQIKIHILPPWWRTWWAFFIYVLLLALLLRVVIYVRWQQKRAEMDQRLNRRLESMVDDRTEQLEHSNQLLATGNEQLKKTQAQLVQSEKMSSLGTLVSGVGHEIGNPSHYTYLAVYNLDLIIKDFKEFLFNLLGAEDEDDIRPQFERYFDKISGNIDSALDGSRRIKAIVENLHTFSRQESGDMQLANIAKGLVTTLELVKANYRNKIHFECNIVDDLPIQCCISELNQVFMNLVVNACQAMVEAEEQTGSPSFPDTPGKSDALVAGTFSVRMYRQDRYLAVSFKDTGDGIPKDLLDHIFEPFFTTKPVGQGTGLGLAISFGIIERHNGTLKVNSVEGEGAEFVLRLPLP